MAGSIEQVLQPDGSYRWEVKEPKKEADETPVVCPAPEPVVEPEVVNQKDFTSMTKSELEELMSKADYDKFAKENPN